MNELENCSNRRLLRNVEPSNEKSRLSIKQAKEWLNESKKNLENDTYKSAHISAYLALFHLQEQFYFKTELERNLIIALEFTLKNM